MKIRLRIKDADGIILTQECDDYNYNTDTRSVLCYEVKGDNKLLIAAYEDVSHFRRMEKEASETK